MIRGTTSLIAHIGYPTHSFKAPMIYNPWFEKKGIDAVVVPMGVRPEDYSTTLRAAITLLRSFEAMWLCTVVSSSLRHRSVLDSGEAD